MHPNELFDVIFRWAHLIAGIMWIGNSMLFNWLDRNLEKHHQLSRLSQGKLFMVHSGAFYDVEKKLLEPGDLPEPLHWFKWQNFATWATGLSLLVVVYYMRGGLVNPSVYEMNDGVAVTLSISSLFTGWIIYDGLWRTIGEKNPRFATALSVAMLFGAIFGFCKVFDGRAAFIQTGVLIGTLMTGNVWLCIMPSQRALVAATKSGKDQDPTLSLRAKQRSIHNNYLTFGLLFIMVSNHFGAAITAYLNWLVLIMVIVGGAGVRYFMNLRYLGEGAQRAVGAWLVPAAMSAGVAMVGLLGITQIAKPGVHIDYAVNFSRAQEIIVKRCQQCHSSHPTDDVFKSAPNGVMMDTAAQIVQLAPKIRERAVVGTMMPYLNKTHITDIERAELGAWIDAGAVVK